MTTALRLLLCSFLFLSCKNNGTTDLKLIGTWKLLTATHIEKADTSITQYNSDIGFIKIINQTHFAFFQHRVGNVADSLSEFVAGSGPYTLKGNSYSEHLEYCSAREWENHDFSFTVTLNGDTLVQEGREKVDNLGVDRINIEKYIRLK